MTVASARSSPLRGWAAAAVTLAVVGRTFLGSARALADIGRRARVSDPWALPIGLDGMAVVAALARHHRRDDRWAQVALIVGVAVSTGLQVAAAPAGLANRITHAVPPVAAWLTFELFLRATDGVMVAKERHKRHIPRHKNDITAGQSQVSVGGQGPSSEAAKPEAPVPGEADDERLVDLARIMASEGKVSTRTLAAAARAQVPPIPCSAKRIGEVVRAVNGGVSA